MESLSFLHSPKLRKETRVFIAWTCPLPATALLTRQRGNSVLDRHGNIVRSSLYISFHSVHTKQTTPTSNDDEFPPPSRHTSLQNTHIHTPPLQRSRQAVESRAAHSQIDSSTLPKPHEHTEGRVRVCRTSHPRPGRRKTPPVASTLTLWPGRRLCGSIPHRDPLSCQLWGSWLWSLMNFWRFVKILCKHGGRYDDFFGDLGGWFRC